MSIFKLDQQDIGLRYQRYGKALISLALASKDLAHARVKAKSHRDRALRQWNNVVNDRHLYADFPSYLRDMAWVLDGDVYDVARMRNAENTVKRALNELWDAQQGVKL